MQMNKLLIDLQEDLLFLIELDSCCCGKKMEVYSFYLIPNPLKNCMYNLKLCYLNFY